MHLDGAPTTRSFFQVLPHLIQVLSEEDEEEEEVESSEEEEAKDEALAGTPEQLQRLDFLNRNEKLSATGQLRREGMKRKEFGLSLILSHVPRFAATKT